jgi:hypothetical protein
MTFGSWLREYLASQRIAANIHQYLIGANEFYSLIMAAARFADTDNFDKLEEAFPEVIQELKARYNAPGGALDQQEREIVERWNQE